MNENKAALEVLNGLKQPVQISIEEALEHKYVQVLCPEYSLRCDLARYVKDCPKTIFPTGSAKRNAEMQDVVVMAQRPERFSEYKLFNLTVAVCKGCIAKRLKRQK